MERNKIIQIEVGDDNYPTNCYVVYDEDNNAIIIDPGYDKQRIISKIEDNNLKVKYIILTHCHADHLGQLEEIMKFTDADVIIHENDLDGLEDDEKSHFTPLNINKPNIEKDKIITVKDKDVIEVGNIELEVIHTPGHTSGCMCLFEKSMNSLFTGDTIFANCYGRVDLKSGSLEDMKNSINKIFDRFEDIIIYPGHEQIVNIDDCKRRIRLLIKIRSM
ncbi:MAG: MBL fold metallo-hydrolase [Clostridia bacterium]|nr:MBL fold metallo-hydrolase [Clostridia bacterium]MDD4386910.1 MBL fold metallo-hydrolase [Clostridia bacterium]